MKFLYYLLLFLHAYIVYAQNPPANATIPPNYIVPQDLTLYQYIADYFTNTASSVGIVCGNQLPLSVVTSTQTFFQTSNAKPGQDHIGCGTSLQASGKEFTSFSVCAADQASGFSTGKNSTILGTTVTTTLIDGVPYTTTTQVPVLLGSGPSVCHIASNICGCNPIENNIPLIYQTLTPSNYIDQCNPDVSGYCNPMAGTATNPSNSPSISYPNAFLSCSCNGMCMTATNGDSQWAPINYSPVPSAQPAIQAWPTCVCGDLYYGERCQFQKTAYDILQLAGTAPTGYPPIAIENFPFLPWYQTDTEKAQWLLLKSLTIQWDKGTPSPPEYYPTAYSIPAANLPFPQLPGQYMWANALSVAARGMDTKTIWAWPSLKHSCPYGMIAYGYYNSFDAYVTQNTPNFDAGNMYNLENYADLGDRKHIMCMCDPLQISAGCNPTATGSNVDVGGTCIEYYNFVAGTGGNNPTIMFSPGGGTQSNSKTHAVDGLAYGLGGWSGSGLNTFVSVSTSVGTVVNSIATVAEAPYTIINGFISGSPSTGDTTLGSMSRPDLFPPTAGYFPISFKNLPNNSLYNWAHYLDGGTAQDANGNTYYGYNIPNEILYPQKWALCQCNPDFSGIYCEIDNRINNLCGGLGVPVGLNGRYATQFDDPGVCTCDSITAKSVNQGTLTHYPTFTLPDGITYPNTLTSTNRTVIYMQQTQHPGISIRKQNLCIVDKDNSICGNRGVYNSARLTLGTALNQIAGCECFFYPDGGGLALGNAYPLTNILTLSQMTTLNANSTFMNTLQSGPTCSNSCRNTNCNGHGVCQLMQRSTYYSSVISGGGYMNIVWDVQSANYSNRVYPPPPPAATNQPWPGSDPGFWPTEDGVYPAQVSQYITAPTCVCDNGFNGPNCANSVLSGTNCNGYVQAAYVNSAQATLSCAGICDPLRAYYNTALERCIGLCPSWNTMDPFDPTGDLPNYLACGGPTRGVCNLFNVTTGAQSCTCNNGYTNPGTGCSLTICPYIKGLPCNGVGQCIPYQINLSPLASSPSSRTIGRCLCPKGWKGDACEEQDRTVINTQQACLSNTQQVNNRIDMDWPGSNTQITNDWPIL